MTLGKFKDEIFQHKGKILDDLKNYLPKLIKLRNNFAHKLFNPGSINELTKKSEEGLNITNKVILAIEKVENDLKKHDPLKITSRSKKGN